MKCKDREPIPFLFLLPNASIRSLLKRKKEKKKEERRKGKEGGGNGERELPSPFYSFFFFLPNTPIRFPAKEQRKGKEREGKEVKGKGTPYPFSSFFFLTLPIASLLKRKEREKKKMEGKGWGEKATSIPSPLLLLPAMRMSACGISKRFVYRWGGFLLCMILNPLRV